MADKKNSTKQDYAAMDETTLTSSLSDKQDELTTARQSHRSGELVNPRILGQIRKDIARIKTALRAHKEKESK